MVIFPIREDWWTPNFILAQVNQTAIIGVYLNPLNKQEQIETLWWMVEDLKQQGLTILITGDFNYERAELSEEALR